MNIGVKVGDIMTRDFISVSPDISILEAAKIMVKKHVGSLIIQEDGNLKGILTEKDIIWTLTKKPKDLHKIKVGDIAKRKVVTIKPNTDLISAINLMKKSKFRRLPVTIKKKVIGIMTLKDILRIEPALFEIARGMDALQIREENEKLERKKHPEDFSIGICEECGKEELLEKTDGRLICEVCEKKM